MSIKVKVGAPSNIRIVAAAEKKPLIVPDSITLGIDTVGNYVAQIDAGAGIIVTSETNIENANLVISHANTSTEISSNNAGLTFAGNIDLDQFGHITQFRNNSFDPVNFSSSNNVISSDNITFGSTALTLGGTTPEIVGLTKLDAGGLVLETNTITSLGNVKLQPAANNSVDVSNARIIQVADPIDGKDVVNKSYLEFELIRVENTVKVIEDPILPSDATNKRYVDNLVTGFVVRPQALAATTADLGATFDEGNTTVSATLSIPPVNFLYIDDVTTWSLGKNLLVKDQSVAAENGSYDLIQVGSANTAWVFQRSSFSTSAELPGSYEFVTDGTINGGSGWVSTVLDASSFNINTDPINWVQFQGEGTFTAGAGLSLNGTQFNLDTTVSLAQINPVSDIVTVSGTGAIKLPEGDSASRPTPTSGMIRFNTEDGQFEGYGGAAWAGLGGVIDVDQDTKVIAETAPGSDNDQLQFYTAGSLAAQFDADNTANFYGDVNINALASTLSPKTTGTINLGSSTKNFDKIFTAKLGADDGVVTIDTTGAMVLPKGTEAQRPAEQIGMLRFNTEDARFEGYDGTAWAGLAGSVIDLDRNTYIIAETSAGADNNDLDFYSAGIHRLQIDQDGNFNYGNNLSVLKIDYTTGNLTVNGKVTSDGNLYLDATGTINASNNTITDVANPVNPRDVVTLNYLDTQFSSKMIIVDNANTYPTSIDLLQNPTLKIGRGLEVQSIDAANNELEVGLDITGVQAAMYGTDGFTPRIRITEDGRIDFATDIPLELQANAIPNFTETSRDIIGLMFEDGNANNEGITAVNDDVGDVMNLFANNFNITLNGDVSGTAQVTRLSDTTISATVANSFVEALVVANTSGLTSTTIDANTPTTLEVDYNHLDTIYAPVTGATFSAQIIAPRYVDSDDTDFYVDPAGTSRLNQIDFGYGETFSQVRFRDGPGSFSVMYGQGGKIGFLDNTFNYAAYSERSTGNWVVQNGDVRAERFVDTDATTYFLHPGGTDSNLKQINVEDKITVSDISIGGDVGIRTIKTATGALVLEATTGISLDGTGDVNVNSSKITNVLNPTAGQDAATKSYVDAQAQGLRVIPSALAATTGNLNATFAAGVLTSVDNEAFSVDGVTTWVVGSRILVKDQTASLENGSYEVTIVGNGSTQWELTRGEYFNDSAEIPGAFQFVTDGTLNRSTGWVATVVDAESFVLGTDDVTWYQFSGAGTYSAGEALTLNGTEFSITDGDVTNNKLANPQFTINGEAGANTVIALGETLTIEGTDGVDTTISSGKVSIAITTLDGGTF